MHVDTHLSDAELHDLLLGKLPDAAEGAAEGHLAACPACQARAASTRAADTFVQLVTAAGTRVAASRAAAATPQLDSSSEGAATQVHSGPPVAPGAFGVPAGLVGHPRYRLVRRLGAGGMGDVWLAEHAVMGRPVALKVIRPEFLSRAGAVERFRREVRAGAALHHPNIVTAFDADEAGGTHFLVMEYVPGEALAAVVARGPLPVADACRAVRDAARGLAHAHAAGLVHRDVKPANLIRATDGATKVLDFGLVGAGAEEATDLTGANMVMGTPDYIAPEQATDARSADARSDVYSLGCTLYHLLAGRVPFPGDTAMQKLDAHRDPARAPAPVANVPAKLARVLARMTAKDPAARYQTAEAVADALDRFCVVLDDEAPTVAAPAAVAARPRSRRRFALAAALVFALAAVAGGVVYKVQRDNEVLTITTDDPDIEVVMRRNGELVRITDTKTNQTWELDAKKMRLKPDGGELSIDVPDGAPVVIRRNGDVAVTIKRTPGVVKVTGDEGTKPIPAAVPRRGEPLRLPGVTESVQVVALSPDGKLAAAGGGHTWVAGQHRPGADFAVRVWEVGTGKLVHTLTGLNGVVSGLAFAPDGGRVAATSGPGEVRVWDATTGKAVTAFQQGRHAAGVAFTPDGKKVFVTGWASPPRLWDASTGKPDEGFKPDIGVGDFGSVALSPDGQSLAVAGWSYLATADAAGKNVRALAITKDSRVGALAYSRDGGRLVSLDMFDTDASSARVRVWDVKTGKELRAFTGRAAAFQTADGSRVLVAGLNDSALTLWDVDTGREVERWTGHTSTVLAVAVSADGRRALSGGLDNTARLWALPEPVKPAPPTGGAASPDPPAPQLKLVRKHDWGARNAFVTSFSPDGKYYTATGDALAQPGEPGVRVWETESGTEALAVPGAGCAVFAPDNRTVYTYTPNDSVIRGWDVKTRKPTAEFKGHTLSVAAVVVSADGKRLVSSSPDKTVRIWDVATRKELHALRFDAAKIPFVAPAGPGFVFSYDYHIEDPLIRLIDVATGETKRTWRNPEKGYVLDLRSDPVGKGFVTVHQKVLRVWAADRDTPVRTVELGHDVGLMAFSSDLRWFLSTASFGADVRLLDLDTGLVRASYRLDHGAIGTHAISADGRHAVVCSARPSEVYLFELPPEVRAPKKP